MESTDPHQDAEEAHAASSVAFDKALRQLGFAVKAKELYPSGSAVVGRSVETAWEALAAHLDPSRPTQIRVLPRTFALDETDPVEEPCLQVVQLAERLHSRGIAAVTVHPTATSGSLEPLLALATTSIDELHERGGLSAVLRRDPIPGLTIELLELARLFESSQENSRSVDAENIWDLVLENFRDDSDQVELDWEALAEDPAALRHLFGWILDDASRNAEFAEFSQIELVTLVCERVAAAALDHGAEQVAKVVDVLKGLAGRLDPEAWIDILSDPMPVEPYSVMQEAAERAGESLSGGGGLPTTDVSTDPADEEIPVVDITQELASSLSSESVEDLIEYSTRTRDEASPRLYRLFDRLLTDRPDRAEIGQRALAKISAGSGPADLIERWPQLDDVLRGERVDPFVTRNYRTTLDHLTGARVASSPWDMTKIGRRMRELDPRFLRSRNSTILLAIMSRESDDADYETMARRIVEAVPDLISDGELDQVENVAREFAAAVDPRSSRTTARRRVARSALGRIAHKDTLRAMLQLTRGDDGQLQRTFLKVIGHLGTIAVPGLLEALAEEDTRPFRLQLARILADMGPAAVPQIAERVDDPRWYFVRNLVWIIGEIRDPENKRLLRDCLSHSDHRVRRETVTSLMKLDSGLVRDALGEALRDTDPEVSLAALRALCQADGPDLARMLREYLQRPNWHGQNTAILAGAARAIGRTGCATALPELRVLARQLWIFRSRRRAVRDAALWAMGQIRRHRRRREQVEADQTADVVRVAA